jgi:uncharacterized coiled-coil DUF342 family protein
LELRTKKKKINEVVQKKWPLFFQVGGEKEENHEVVCGGDRKKEVEDQIAPLLITTKTHMGPG